MNWEKLKKEQEKNNMPQKGFGMKGIKKEPKK